MTEMTLYVVRHGDAVGPDVDPERPLSQHGVDEVTAIAGALAARGASVSQVVHSGKMRATQTAEILANHIASDVTPQRMSGLNPNDDPSAIVAYVNAETEDTLIAGHMPSVGLIVRTLVPSASMEFLNFATAMVVVLTRGDDGTWRIDSRLSPSEL